MSKGYKYCIVPECVSTTTKTPGKIFFLVPRREDMRRKWFEVIERDLLAPKSTRYVCEDHFDIENDAENLIKYRLVGGTLKLKPDVYPHRFTCRKSGNLIKNKSGRSNKKQNNQLSTKLKKDAETVAYCEPFEVVECNLAVDDELQIKQEYLPQDIATKNEPEAQGKTFQDMGVQADIKVEQRHKYVQTDESYLTTLVRASTIVDSNLRPQTPETIATDDPTQPSIAYSPQPEISGSREYNSGTPSPYKHLKERHFPALYSSDKTKRQNPMRRCIVCSMDNKRRSTRYYCKQCNVGLCVVPCFEMYHTKQ